MALSGRTPTADERRHMNRVVSLGCIACWISEGIYSPAEIHHLEGKTKPGAHFKIIGLCHLHHREGGNTERYVSYHPWKNEFHKRYGSAAKLLAKVDQMLGATA